MMDNITKWCTSCKTRHPLIAFGKDRMRHDGLRAQCRNSRHTDTPKRTPQQRFDAKTTPGANGCVEWTGSKYPSGYGEFYYDGRIQAAHRVAWLLAGHEIPVEMYVLHRCDNRGCVSVAHLFLGTHDDNMADMAAKGRHAKQDGETNPNARLTAIQVAEIRALKGEKSQAAIGAAYGVSKTMVRRIHQGKAWQEFPA